MKKGGFCFGQKNTGLKVFIRGLRPKERKKGGCRGRESSSQKSRPVNARPGAIFGLLPPPSKPWAGEDVEISGKKN